MTKDISIKKIEQWAEQYIKQDMFLGTSYTNDVISHEALKRFEYKKSTISEFLSFITKNRNA